MKLPNQKSTNTSEILGLQRICRAFGYIVFALISASASVSAGAMLAVTPAGSIVNSGVPYALTTAWDFTLTQSFQVSALNFYSNGTPYLGSDPVGLWAVNTATGYPVGTLLASVTFSASTPGTANGLYRSLPITPISLGPGAYEVGVLLQPNSDPYLFSQSSYALLPGILFMGGHVNTSGAFVYPGSSNFISGNFAANFEAQPVSSTPEPGPAILLLTGLAFVAICALRKPAVP